MFWQKVFSGKDLYVYYSMEFIDDYFENTHTHIYISLKVSLFMFSYKMISKGGDILGMA